MLAAADSNASIIPPRVELTIDHELASWCRRWGVAAEDIRDAVSHVGDRPADVARYLGKTEG